MKKNKIVFIILYIVFIGIYFLYKCLSLNNYDKHNGKILHMAGISIPVVYKDRNSYELSSGTKNYPYIEYYKKEDTLNATNKSWNSFLLKTGDKITVLVNYGDKKDIKLYTLFNYWLHTSTIILFFFLFFIGLGFTTISFKDFTEE